MPADHPLTILALEAENFKRLRAVTIVPHGPTVVLKGANEQGKTSVLDAIWAALGGANASPAEPIRRGEKKATVTLDLGEYVVTRRWTLGGSTLTVTTRDGEKIKSPQAILDGLVGRLSFDPLEFFDAKPLEQQATLKKLAGIDFTDLERRRARIFEDRTLVNREVEGLRGTVARMPDPANVAAAPVDVAKLLEEQATLMQEDRARTKLAADTRVAESARAALQREEEDALNELAILEKRRKELEQRRIDITKNHVETQKAVDAALAAERAARDPQPLLAELAQRLASADATNRAVREHAAIEEKRAELKSAEDRSQGYTDALTGLDKEKRQSLEDAFFPVDGLSLDDTGVTFNGLPLEQASGARRIQISVAIGLALNPKLRVILIRDGSNLDDDAMVAVEAQAAEHDAQIWIERVARKGDNSPGILIVDGAVEES